MEGQKGGVSATDIPWHAAWLLSCRTKTICGSCPLPLRSDHGVCVVSEQTLLSSRLPLLEVFAGGLRSTTQQHINFVIYHFASERGAESLGQWVLHFYLYHF